MNGERPKWWTPPWQAARWFVAGAATGMVLILLAVLPTPIDFDRGAGTRELVIMIDYDQSFGQQRHRLFREWNDTHPDKPARFIEIPPSATAAHSQLVAHAQSDAGGIDVYSLDVTWIAEFAKEDWIRPLDMSTIDEDAFLEKPLQAGEYDGKLWALPFNTDAGLLFYRRDLVGDDPPETWQEMRERTERVWAEPDHDGTAPLAGYAGQFADYEGFTVNVLEAILAEDRTSLAEAELSVTQQTMDAFDRLVNGLHDPVSDDPHRRLILPASLDHREDGSTAAFQQGEVLFMRNWPVAYRQLTTAGDDDEEDEPPLPPEAVGVTRLPSVGGELPGPSILGGQSLAVAGESDQPEAAQELIAFLTGARSQEKLFVAGGFAPTRRVIYHDQELRSSYPYLETLREAVEDARPRPVHQRYELFSEALRRQVRRSLVNPGDNPLPSAATLDEALDDALSGHRR